MVDGTNIRAHRPCCRGQGGRHRREISAVVPLLKTDKAPRLIDWAPYRERNAVECLVGRLKQYRRIATCYDKLASNYLAFVHLPAVRMRL